MKINTTLRDLLTFLIISLTGYGLALASDVSDDVIYQQNSIGMGVIIGHHLIFVLMGLSLSSAGFIWWRWIALNREMAYCKQVEQTLIEHKQFIQSVMTTTPDVIFLYDTVKQRPTFISRRLIDELGYDQYEADPPLPELLQRFFHPEDIERFQAHIARLEASQPGEIILVEFRLRHKDGSWRWFQDRDLVFKRGAEGRVLEVLGAMRDITGRKEAELALGQERGYLRQIIDAVPGHLVVKDSTGRFILANQTMATTFGMDVANLIGKTDADLNLNADEVSLFLAKNQETLTSGQVKYIPAELVTYPDGQVHWHTTYRVPLFDKQGQASELLVISTDITPQKQAQDQIHFQAQLLDRVGQAVIATDLSGRITYWNQAATTIYGWSTEEVLGQNAFEFLAVGSKQKQISDQIALVTATGFWQGENTARRRDGSSFPIFATVTTFADSQSEMAGLMSVSTDITELKRTEAEIRQLNAELEERIQQRTIELTQTNYLLRQEIAVRKKVEGTLQERVEVETILAAISTRFINLTASEIDNEINWALQAIVLFTRVDRAGIALLSEDHQTWRLSHEWCASGVKLQLHHLQNVPFDLLPSFQKKMKRGQIINIGRVADLPDVFEREFLQKQGIRSLASVPLLYRGELKGFLAFDSLKVEKRWRDEDLALLSLFGEILVNALQRRQAEETLRASEARYYSLFEDSPISLWEEDFSGVKARIEELRMEGVEDFRAYLDQHPQIVAEIWDLIKATDVNRASLELLGANDKSQVLGKFKDAFTPKSYHTFTKELVAISEGQTRFDFETAIYTVNKEEREVTIQWSAAPGYEETLEKVFVSIIDISQRKRAEAALRQRNRELSLLNRVIAASVVGVEPELMLETSCRELALAFETDWAMALLFDKSKELAKVVASHSPQSQVSPLHQTLPLSDLILFQTLIITQAPLVIANTSTDLRLQAFGDLVQQYNLTSLLGLPLIIEGQVTGCLILATTEPRSFSADEVSLGWNIADQVAGGLGRARMAETNQRLIAAIEQVTDAVIMTDTKDQILYVNEAFEQITGYSQAEVLGQSSRILVSDNQSSALTELLTTITAGQTWHGRLVNRKKDGTLYTCDTTVTPIYNESKVLVNYVTVERDVTQTLQLEEQYRQAQKMESIGRMAGGVAHDFNNILTAIMGYTGLSLHNLPEDSPIRANLKGIEASAERAANLTRQLLAFARKQIIEPQPVNLNELIASDSKILRRLITEDIELVIVSTADLGWVRADPGQLEQVLFNLVVNARDAMPEGGKLILETTNATLRSDEVRHYAGMKPGDYILLKVTDTGTGMSDEVKTHIFEPFFTTKELGKGTGLGLATCFGIIKQSNGHIWVESELNQGTTFKIYLPRVAQVGGRTSVVDHSLPLPGGKETVLLVEDEPLARDTLAQTLRGLGYTVVEAQNGEEAIQEIEKLGPGKLHLLIADLIMPHLGGKALVDKIKPLHPDLKVLLMSGYMDEVISKKYMTKVGAVFLQKPFAPPTIAYKVRALLDDHIN